MGERALSEPDPLIAAVMTGGVARHDVAGRAAWLFGALASRHLPAVRAAAA
ncbi:hypothetical protein AB0952_35950 [Streptomyces caniferus]|uniref:hypothetical protein n=1 Tax=Streptomyces caniferus TaxID=285557 RepID=UPI0034550C9F